jgi:hypothetical protein
MNEEDSIMDRPQKEFNDYIAKEVRDMKVQLAQNTVTTDEVAEILRPVKGFFRHVGTIGRWLRRFIIWVAPIAGGIYALLQLFKELFKTKGP